MRVAPMLMLHRSSPPPCAAGELRPPQTQAAPLSLPSPGAALSSSLPSPRPARGTRWRALRCGAGTKSSKRRDTVASQLADLIRRGLRDQPHAVLARVEFISHHEVHAVACNCAEGLQRNITWVCSFPFTCPQLAVPLLLTLASASTSSCVLPALPHLLQQYLLVRLQLEAHQHCVGAPGAAQGTQHLGHLRRNWQQRGNVKVQPACARHNLRACWRQTRGWQRLRLPWPV